MVRPPRAVPDGIGEVYLPSCLHPPLAGGGSGARVSERPPPPLAPQRRGSCKRVRLMRRGRRRRRDVLPGEYCGRLSLARRPFMIPARGRGAAGIRVCLLADTVNNNN